ncbi:hypothetical protein AALB39_04610 [Lachnospiraceae bacterium 54-53]
MFATIHPIAPFDSSVGTNINFTWSGNQIYKVRCIIKNNATGVTVYDSTLDTMKQSYTFPPTPTLTNGTKYVAYITVFDVDENESTIQSVGTPFYCFSTPTFNLSVSNGDIIRASSYSIGLNYAQIETESLNWFNITLYSYQKTLLDSSGQVYDITDLSYIVSNLENATQYYIRGTGETVNGMSLDTGYILVTVSYTTAQIFSKLELNNISETGAIEIKSNIISAEGVPEKDVIYVDGEWVDLTDNSVTFDEGFEIGGDFTAIFHFKKPKRNSVIIEFGTKDKLNIKVYYRIGSYSDSNGEKAYFELVANSCGINHVINSNYVEVHSDDYYKYTLIINRVDRLFDVKALVVSTLVRYSSSPDGTNMTESRQPNSQYVGVGYMPREVWENPNLLNNSDFRSGFDNWVVDQTATTGEISNGILKITAKDISYQYYRVYYSGVNPFNDIELMNYLYCYVEAYSSNTSNLYVGQLLQNITNDWSVNELTGAKSGYAFPMKKRATNTLSIQLPRNKTININSIAACKNPVNHYYPSPSDWLADPGNYTWVAI